MIGKYFKDGNKEGYVDVIEDKGTYVYGVYYERERSGIKGRAQHKSPVIYIKRCHHWEGPCNPEQLWREKSRTMRGSIFH